MTSSLIEPFSSLKGPRIDRNKKHGLIDIIVLSFCVVCSGANGREAIVKLEGVSMTAVVGVMI